MSEDSPELSQVESKNNIGERIALMHAAADRLRYSAKNKVTEATLQIGISLPALWMQAGHLGPGHSFEENALRGVVILASSVLMVRGVREAYEVYSRTGEANAMDTAAHMAQLLIDADKEVSPTPQM